MNPGRYRLTLIFSLFATLVLLSGLLLSGCASDKSKVDNYLSEAQGFFDKGEFQKAIIQLKNAIGIQNDSEKAYDLLSKSYMKLGNGQEAFKAFSRLEQIDPDNLDYKLQTASFYLLGKNKDEAERRVDAVLAKEPENIQALYLHTGIMSLDKADLKEIKKVYLHILDIDSSQSRAHLALAQLYGAEKNAEKVEFHLKEAVMLEPDNIRYSSSLYRLYLAQRRFDDAKAVVEALIAKKPDEAGPLILLSTFYQGMKEPEKVEATLLKAIDLEPENIKPRMLLAKVYFGQNRLKDAEGQIQNALKIDPDNFMVKNAYADFCFSTKAIDKANALVDEILSIRPDYMPSKLLKGKILAQKKDWEDAIEIFHELVKEEPDSSLINFLLGSAYFENNKLDQAKSYISKALEINPNLFQARLVMADIFYKQGDFYLAENHIKKALAQVPKHYNANLLLGNINMANKNWPMAKTIFEELIAQDPENPAAYYRYGLIDRIENKPDQAIEHFNAALNLNPNLMDVFTSLISVMADQKEYDKAIKRCDEQLKKAKNSPIIESVVLNLKGNMLLASNRTEQAKTILNQAIDKNPAYVTPYLTLAQLLVRAEKTKEAIALYQTLIEHRPDLPAPHGLLGNLYEQQKKIDLAEASYKKALEINPDYIQAANNLAFLYAEQGKELNTALELASQAKAKAGRLPAVMDTLGWVYYKKQLYDNAIDEFQGCIDQKPENPIFHYHLGLALNKKGEYIKAENALKKALALQKDFQGAKEAREVLDQL